MTKNELIKFLESYSDDTKIFVITRNLDRSNLTTVKPVVKAHGYTWPRDKLKLENFLEWGGQYRVTIEKV